jgi:hypothetical protein
MNRIPAFAGAKIDIKPLSWVRFTWDLMKLPAAKMSLPEHYQITRATKEDETELRKVFSSSFMLDPVWNPAIGDVMQKVQTWLDRALDSSNNVCLALRHGARIIGASVLSLDPNIDNHLMPGPTVLMEYRNRGFGTHLLEGSLHLLRESDLTRAMGIARDVAPVTRFLYPKFGGVVAPFDVTTSLAA